MNTVNEILTKKDYSKKYHRRKNIEPINSDKPMWVKIIFVICIVLAAMGDQKALNRMFGGLPKAISIGVIALAFFYGLYKSDYRSLKKILTPTIMYVGLLVLIMVYSLIVWILGFTELSSMIRGGSKLVFQLVAVLVAVSGVYLFGKESIKLFLISFIICNSLIMLIEMPKFGIGASISSLVHSIITFGDAKGYARALEIHDLTFIMGQFAIYYLIFAPKNTKNERKERKFGIIASATFFTIGMKRIAFFGLGVALLLGLAIRNKKNVYKIVMCLGVVMTAIIFVFIYTVRTGNLMELLEMIGIDTMGRTNAWKMASEYYEISPLFLGHGFESVDAIIKEWVVQGKTKAAYTLHNDYLKAFIELGFYGFTIWLVSQYIVYPVMWKKSYDSKTSCVYMCILIYMSFTFMTDNTAFSFWSTMALRLLPLAYASGVEKPKPVQKWQIPTSKEIEYRIRELSEKTNN